MMAKVNGRGADSGEDFEVVAIEHVGRKPNPVYFFPVITFIVLLYFNRFGIELDSGYVSALLGVAIVSTLVQSAFVGFGLITNEWYSIRTRSKSIGGEVLIGIISLFSSQFTFFIVGFNEQWYPLWGNIKWFIWGFIIYQIMWVVFIYFYTYKGGFWKDTRMNVFAGMLTSISIGIIGVYAIIGV